MKLRKVLCVLVVLAMCAGGVFAVPASAAGGDFGIIWQGDADGWQWNETKYVGLEGMDKFVSGNTLTFPFASEFKYYDDFLASSDGALKIIIMWFGGEDEVVADLGIKRAYLKGTDEGDFDLGAFTWTNNANQEGWRSNKTDGAETNLSTATLQSAEALVLELNDISVLFGASDTGTGGGGGDAGGGGAAGGGDTGTGTGGGGATTGGDDKGGTATGAQDVAVLLGVAIAAAGAVVISRKRK